MVKTVAMAQVNTVLLTVTFPCTLVGLRWDITCVNGAAVVDTIFWGIVIVRDGLLIGSLALSDAGDFYTPEKQMMTFGIGSFLANTAGTKYEANGATKTMRKMMGGDQLVFTANGEVDSSKFLRGVIQFFCKT